MFVGDDVGLLVGLDMVFVGGAEITEQSYYQKCLEEAKGYDNIHFLGWLPQGSSLLQSAYANAKLVILPSHHETFGLVLLEGGMAGADLALSNTLPILCYSSFSNCKTFNPDNVKQMREVIKEVFERPKDATLKGKLMKEFNWDTIIDNHIKIYSGQ